MTPSKPPASATRDLEQNDNGPLMGQIEIQTTTQVGINMPLGLLTTMRTQPEQTVVVDTLTGTVTLQDKTPSASDVSSVLESSLTLRTTIAGLDVLV